MSKNSSIDSTPLKPQPVGKHDPNNDSLDFPDPSLRPDKIFHGGSGQTPPPAQKAATAKLTKDMDGRGTHDATGSYDHLAGDAPQAQDKPPVKSKAGAPGLK
jgi:hypothetical protein